MGSSVTTNEVPFAVLACVLSDGTKATDRIGQEPAWVSDLDDAVSFRKVWEVRGFVDVPIWRDLGYLSAEVARRWQEYTRELLAFIDRNAALGMCLYSFTKARVCVLYCGATDQAMDVGFPPK